MAVIKEFNCKAHGPFEEFVEQDVMPRCPHGCSPRFVVREIRSAPAARGVVVGTLDTLQRGIAHDFGLSDLKVKRDDPSSVIQNLRKGEDFSPKWVDVPNKMAPGWQGRGEKPSAIDVAKQFNVTPDNALARVAPPKMQTNIVGSYKGELPSA